MSAILPDAYHRRSSIPGEITQNAVSKRVEKEVLRSVSGFHEYANTHLKLPDAEISYDPIKYPRLAALMQEFDIELNLMKTYDRMTPDKTSAAYRRQIRIHRKNLKRISRKAGYEISKQIFRDMRRTEIKDGADGIITVITKKLQWDKRDVAELFRLLGRLRLPRGAHEKQDKNASVCIGRGSKRTLDIGALRALEQWIYAALDNKKKTTLSATHRAALQTVLDQYIPLIRMTDAASYKEYLAAGGSTGKESATDKAFNRAFRQASGVGLGLLAVLSGMSNPGHISTLGFSAGSLWAFGFFDGHNAAGEVVDSDGFKWSLDAFKGPNGAKMAERLATAKNGMLPIPRTKQEKEKGVTSSSFTFSQAMKAWRAGKVSPEQMADWFQMGVGNPARKNFLDLIARNTDIDNPRASQAITLIQQIHGLPKRDLVPFLDFLKKKKYEMRPEDIAMIRAAGGKV